MEREVFYGDYDVCGALWRIGVTDGAVCMALPVAAGRAVERVMRRISRDRSVASMTERRCDAGVEAARQIEEYVEGRRTCVDFGLWLTGTEFQLSVWRELMRVGRGRCVSYGELARLCGRELAVRAVASACGANAVLIAVPCHRVVASDGGLGGFSCGVGLKRRLLDIEGAPI